MSIQPNRVIHRIIEQVDRSDWPTIRGHLVASAAMTEAGETLRLYRVARHPRYATPLHFWVHALREELRATGRREDLVATACHAEGRKLSAAAWLEELRALGVAEVDVTKAGEARSGVGDLARLADGVVPAAPTEIYRMLESPCLRSSVATTGDVLMAYFWTHGAAPSWRRSA